MSKRDSKGQNLSYSKKQKKKSHLQIDFLIHFESRHNRRKYLKLLVTIKDLVTVSLYIMDLSPILFL